MRLAVLVSFIAVIMAGCATLDTRPAGDSLGLSGFSASQDYPRCAGTAEAGGCPPWQDWPR